MNHLTYLLKTYLQNILVLCLLIDSLALAIAILATSTPPFPDKTISNSPFSSHVEDIVKNVPFGFLVV